jgi:hypothetical protein
MNSGIGLARDINFCKLAVPAPIRRLATNPVHLSKTPDSTHGKTWSTGHFDKAAKVLQAIKTGAASCVVVENRRH